jgi:hypothetical protein
MTQFRGHVKDCMPKPQASVYTILLRNTCCLFEKELETAGEHINI